MKKILGFVLLSVSLAGCSFQKVIRSQIQNRLLKQHLLLLQLSQQRVLKKSRGRNKQNNQQQLVIKA
jgi:uncharacterized protein YcfL